MEISDRVDQKTDHLLSQRIDHALWSDESLHGTNHEDIQILCRAGVVRLGGHVGTLLQKTQINDVVGRVPNISALENKLIVDDELIYQVAHILAYDSRIHSERYIVVNVQHGFVYLSGSASSATACRFASEIVAGIPQVRGVINRIQAPGIVADEEENRILQPTIGLEIFANDGGIGRLQKVILNPHNRRVSALVLLAHFPASTVPSSFGQKVKETEKVQAERSVVIPVSAIRNSLNSGVFLTISSHQVAQFANLNPDVQVSPPKNWQPPYPYHPTDVLLNQQQPLV